MLAAQQAPIGAKICTAKRKQDYGQKILKPPSHRNTHPSPPNHSQSPEVEIRFPALSVHAATNSLVGVFEPQEPGIAAPTPLPRGVFRQAALQPKLAQSQSFRRLLEF